VNRLNHALSLIEDECTSLSSSLITKFEKMRKHAFININVEGGGGGGGESGQNNNEVMITPDVLKQVSDANESLLGELMDAEDHHMEQTELILEEFGRRLKELFDDARVDHINNSFGILIKLETREAELMASDTMREAERLASGAAEQQGGGGTFGGSMK
jgi:hypothetical protein